MTYLRTMLGVLLLPALAVAQLVTYQRLLVTAIPGAGAGAVTVISAGSIVNGCEIQNEGPTAVHFTLSGTAATRTDEMLQPGQSYNCPKATASAMSVINDSYATGATISGSVF